MTYTVNAVRNQDIVETLVIRQRAEDEPFDLERVLEEINTFLKSKSVKWRCTGMNQRGFIVYRGNEERFALLSGDAVYWSGVDHEFFKIDSRILDNHWTGIGEPFAVHEHDPMLKLRNIERGATELADLARRKTAER